MCRRVPLLSVFLHLGAVMFYDFNHPSEYKEEHVSNVLQADDQCLVNALDSINQSNLAFVKCHLNKSYQRHPGSNQGASDNFCYQFKLQVRLHKEPIIKLLTTDVNVLAMRWQHVPDLGCHDTETAWTITRSPSTWHNHVIVVSGVKLGVKGNGDDWYTDVMAGDRPQIQFCGLGRC